MKKKLKDQLEKFNEEIHVKKDKKLYWDKKAFREERACKWDIAPTGTSGNRPFNIVQHFSSSRQPSKVGYPASTGPTQSQGSRCPKRLRQSKTSIDKSSEIGDSSSVHTSGHHTSSHNNTQSKIQTSHNSSCGSSRSSAPSSTPVSGGS